MMDVPRKGMHRVMYPAPVKENAWESRGDGSSDLNLSGSDSLRWQQGKSGEAGSGTEQSPSLPSSAQAPGGVNDTDSATGVLSSMQAQAKGQGFLPSHRV